MNKIPTVREALSIERKKAAAFKAAQIALNRKAQAPHLQLQKKQADVEAYIKKTKRAALAPAMEAEKRRIEDRLRRVEETAHRIKEDEAIRAPHARMKREHEAQIAEHKKAYEAARAPLDRAKREHQAEMARLRPRR